MVGVGVGVAVGVGVGIGVLVAVGVGIGIGVLVGVGVGVLDGVGVIVAVGVGVGTKFGSHLSSIGLTASLKPATSHWAVMDVRFSRHTLATKRLSPFIPEMNASTSGGNVALPSVDSLHTSS